MASARVFLLLACVAMVFSSSVAEKDLWATLSSDARFKLITKGFTDIGEVDALKSRASGSTPFVFIGQTDESFISELGSDTVACMTSPEQVKNSFAQILRFLQVPVTEPVKSGAELAALAKKSGDRLSTVNGMPLFVESQAPDATVIVSADENNMELVATVSEVTQINANVSLVVLSNGLVMPTQLESQIRMDCGAVASASLPVPGEDGEEEEVSKPAPKSKSATKSKKEQSSRMLLRGNFW